MTDAETDVRRTIDTGECGLCAFPHLPAGCKLRAKAQEFRLGARASIILDAALAGRVQTTSGDVAPVNAECQLGQAARNLSAIAASNSIINPDIDSIAEIKILASSYAAEFRGRSGAMVDVVTKSGTHEFHGALSGFVRNDVFDARSSFACTNPPQPFHDFGWTLGGPVYWPGKRNTERRHYSSSPTRSASTTTSASRSRPRQFGGWPKWQDQSIRANSRSQDVRSERLARRPGGTDVLSNKDFNLFIFVIQSGPAARTSVCSLLLRTAVAGGEGG